MRKSANQLYWFLVLIILAPTASANAAVRIINWFQETLGAFGNMLIFAAAAGGLWLIIVKGLLALNNKDDQTPKSDKWKAIGLGVALVGVTAIIGILYNDFGITASAGTNDAVMFGQ